jgi:murein DD-endopeptidase MepM/ murein hydrolase activator NlpD
MDLLNYFKGDGRPWGVTHSWAGDGQMQSQLGQLPDQFFLVKGMFGSACPWEEFRFDGDFIYRGFDISSSDSTFYRLTDIGKPASAWARRNMNLGDWFQRHPTVTFYDASGTVISQSLHLTWLQFTQHHPIWTSGHGLTVQDVIEIQVFDGDHGRDSGIPFEVYFYAMNVGMVGWRGTIAGRAAQTDVNFIWPSGSVLGAPTLVRRPLPGTLTFAGLPEASAQPAPAVAGMPRTIRAGIQANVRQQPSTSSQRIDILLGGATVFVVNSVPSLDGDGFQWLERAAGGYIREDLFEGFISSNPPLVSRQRFAAPVSGYTITGGFSGANGHKGVDLGVNSGTPVQASGAGQVAFLYSCSKCTANGPSVLDHGLPLNSPIVLNDPEWGFGFGNGVVVRYAFADLPSAARDKLDQLALHNAFILAVHGHMSQVNVFPGQAVVAGTTLGLSGNTGNSSGPHLHLETRATFRSDDTSILNRTLLNPNDIYSL